MPKTRSPQDIIDSLLWVTHLSPTPWSRGILDTAGELQQEIEGLEEERRKRLGEIAAEILRRMKVLRAMPARAEREAVLIYDEKQVKGAKKIQSPPQME